MNIYSTRITVSHSYEPGSKEANYINQVLDNLCFELQADGFPPMVERFKNMEQIYLEFDGLVLTEAQ